ncbi:phage tail protein [Escherichia coli]|uniref:tail fiber protein n=8 Tax=Escherichia coli TaxID=562 RepID=UPI000B7EAD71|nr:tail fiber protein [Escherichia coli]EFM9359776.1 phage tail protein [Escherichia coli]EGM5947381.1 phage tail protein [Escherichia coli]EIU9965448.1 tail fiber protein [Escherichia coli]SQM41202.1 putative tail fiber protein (GpH) [Escherichia coli]HAX4024741.1 phage tail protein [Escherichia coli]
MSTTTRKFKTVITDTGAKKLAQAAAPDGKPVRLTHMAVGDGGGTLPTPDSKQTRLVHEVWRHTVNRVILDATHQNRIIAELVIPPETGGFWIREIGVFDEHGDLIAVGNTAESYKPTVAEGSGRAQTFRTILTVSSTATVALTVDNTMVMATVDYVDDKLKEHEQSRRHPDASLTAKGFVQLSSATNSVSETQAATPKAVKAAYDLANGKYTAQDASTTRKGLVQLSSATNSTSETQAATPKAVKAAYDLANAKYTAQDATTAQKGIVQLSSATNSTSETLAATSKAVKAVMDETNKKAPLNSPALTGTPTTPTARQGTNNTQIASTAFVMAAIAALVDSSPDALNTLNELAAALGNDPNFATTMTNALAGKQPKDATLTALAGLATAADKFPYFTGNDVASLATLTKVGRDILAKSTVAAVIEYLGLQETVNQASGALQKNQNGADIPDKRLFLRNIGATNSTTMSFNGGAGWFKLATVTMPQASSVVYISLIGGAGFNVGSPHQAGISELVLRAGNGNPKGITGALWRRTSVGFTNFAWVNTSGDTYDVYVEIGNYATGVNIQWDYTSNASVTIHTSPTYTANKPTGLTDGTVYVIYSSHIKPTAAEVGALSLSGGQLNGALGIGTSSALGGNSIVLGDNDTGFKQNGDGYLDVYANNVHVMRFVSGSIQSNKTINITGRVNPSDYGNFDSRYVKDVRLGSQQYYGVNNWQTWNFQCPSGHVLSGINVQDTGSNSADNIAGVYYRPVQKYINGTWYNVASV